MIITCFLRDFTQVKNKCTQVNNKRVIIFSFSFQKFSAAYFKKPTFGLLWDSLTIVALSLPEFPALLFCLLQCLPSAGGKLLSSASRALILDK